MVTTAMAGVHLSVRRGPPGRAHGCHGAPVGGTALASRRSPDPFATCRRRTAGRGSRDRPGHRPASRHRMDLLGRILTGTRTREVTSLHEVRRSAYAGVTVRLPP